VAVIIRQQEKRRHPVSRYSWLAQEDGCGVSWFAGGDVFQGSVRAGRPEVTDRPVTAADDVIVTDVDVNLSWALGGARS
jgi:hypothetical protein